MNALLRFILVVLAALAVLAPIAQGQTTIAMKSSATVDFAAAVRLSQIAELTGPDAEKLGAVVIVPAPTASGNSVPGSMTIDPAMVRRGLDASSVNWAKISLSGVPCKATQGRRQTEPVVKGTPRPAKQVHEPVEVGGTATTRTLIAIRLAALYGVPVEDLRLKFVSQAPEDKAILDLVADGSKRIEVHPGAHGELRARERARRDLHGRSAHGVAEHRG